MYDVVESRVYTQAAEDELMEKKVMVEKEQWILRRTQVSVDAY
jgi:hypothetical protein